MSDEVMTPMPVETKPIKVSLLPTTLVRVLKRFTLGYLKDRESRGWSKPEYDLSEVDKAEGIESLLKISINKYTERILNCGWHLRGKNPATRAYIQRRLQEFSLVTSIPWEITLSELLRNLVKYNNSFVYLRRSNKFSSGNMIKLYGTEIEPIAGVFCVDPTSMEPRTDKYNNVTQWKQRIEDAYSGWLTGGSTQTEKTYEAYQIIHIYRCKKSGFVFGEPDYLPVFDDMRALRQVEDQVDLLIHKHAFPLFHLKVGTPEHPARTNANGVSEVDEVKAQFNNLESDGALITSERVDIKAIGTEGKALDATPYIDNYRQRVKSGVYLSDIDLGLGDSSNKATARQLSLGFQDRCKSLQHTMEQFITHQLFTMLLLEGGYPPNQDNIVEFKFNEIDLENRMSINNHASALYVQHMITQTEARNMANLPPLNPDQKKDMYFEVVEKPRAIIQAIDEPGTPESKAATRAASSKNQPANQEGKKVAKTQAQNDVLNVKLNAILANHAAVEDGLEDMVNSLCYTIATDMSNQIGDGMESVSDTLFVGQNITNGFAELLKGSVKEVCSRFKQDIKRAEDTVDKTVAVDMCADALSALLFNINKKAQDYGIIRARVLLDGASKSGIQLKNIHLEDLEKIIDKFI